MTSYVCKFPDGKAGAGLFVLRLSVAGYTINAADTTQAADTSTLLVQLCVAMLTLVLLLGGMTRSVALLCGAALVLGPETVSAPLMVTGAVGSALALLLLGPGAFSLDARLHGRRVIHLRTDSSNQVDE